MLFGKYKVEGRNYVRQLTHENNEWYENEPAIHFRSSAGPTKFDRSKQLASCVVTLCSESLVTCMMFIQ